MNKKELISQLALTVWVLTKALAGELTETQKASYQNKLNGIKDIQFIPKGEKNYHKANFTCSCKPQVTDILMCGKQTIGVKHNSLRPEYQILPGVPNDR